MAKLDKAMLSKKRHFTATAHYKGISRLTSSTWHLPILILFSFIIFYFGTLELYAQDDQSDSLELDQITDQIERRRKTLPSQPTYHYSTDSFADTVSTVWTDVTRNVLGSSELRINYDDFYGAALEYHTIARLNLIHAERHVSARNIHAAQKSLEDFTKSIELLRLSEMGAFAVWDGDLSASQELARGIYQGSKASLVFAGWASKPILGPSVSSLVDAMFMATDFAIESTESSLQEATKSLVSKALVKAIFQFGKVDALGGRSFSEAIDDGVTVAVGQSGLHSMLNEILASPELKTALMSIFANSTSGAIQKLSEYQYTRIVEAIINSASPTSTVNPDSSDSNVVNKAKSLSGIWHGSYVIPGESATQSLKFILDFERGLVEVTENDNGRITTHTAEITDISDSVEGFRFLIPINVGRLRNIDHVVTLDGNTMTGKANDGRGRFLLNAKRQSR